MAFRWNGVGVEGDQRVFRSMLLERIVESKKAGEVLCVCNECCPYFDGSVSAVDKDGRVAGLPLFEATTRVGSGFVDSDIVSDASC